MTSSSRFAIKAQTAFGEVDIKRSKSAKKRTTRTKKKSTRRSGLTKRQLLTAAAVVLGIILTAAFLLHTYPVGKVVKKRTAAKEIGPNAVYGKIIGVNIEAIPRGTIWVKSFNTGKRYTFWVGWRTIYQPPRYPYKGEKVTVHYVYDRGYLKATQIIKHR
ncbi:MAG: hypothetical protein JRI46_00480 [Deltaproteobacteria bacterium]|nr:hypothetical protein [Deltaproteobacteria bacterium]